MSEQLDLDENSEVIPLDQQEDESDLLENITYKDSVIMNTDWTVETIFNQIRKGNIDLQPEFQRRSAWDDTRKSRLIESIIVGMPVPNIVIAENKNSKGRFIVIDGKQRLLSIKDFFENNLSLKGLDIREDLNGHTISELPTEDKESLENSTIRSSLIKNWRDDKFLYAIFYRLNSGSLPLSPQELRKALVGGRLIDKIESYLQASTDFKAIFGAALDKRMRDSELVIRYIAFDKNYLGYKGDLKDFLDRATSDFEANDAAQDSRLESILTQLDMALSVTHQVFGDKSFKKWTGEKFERRINRAIFDCITRFFSDSKVATLSISKKTEIFQLYKTVCENQEFKNSIEKTTKSVEATSNRINIWGSNLAAAIGLTYNPTTGRIS